MESRAKKTGVSLIATFSICVLLLLVGCSASSSQTANEPDVPELDASMIMGNWVVESSGSSTLESNLEQGIFQWMNFGENGVFTLTIQATDTPLVRTGTYRIEGEKAYITVPELPKQTGTGIISSISAPAIQDGEISFEGDTLTTTSISTEGALTTAIKVTDEQIKGYIEQVSNMAAQPISIGETVEDEDFRVTLTNAYVSSSLEDPNSSTYWEADDGATFAIMEFDIEALNSNEIAVGSGAVANVVGNFNGNTYKGWDYKYVVSQLWLSAKRTYFEANMPVHVYVYTSIPAAAEDGGVTVDMDVAGQPRVLSM